MKPIIFRNQLFKFSEPFIHDQAKALNLDLLYLGRVLSGKAPLNYRFITLEEQNLITNILFVLFRSITKLATLVGDYKSDIIHAHFAIDAVYALGLKARLNIPLVTTLHGFDVTTSSKSLFCSLKPAWINFLMFRKRLQRNCDRFICVSDFIKNKALQQGYPENKLITHYIGIELPPIRYSKKHNGAIEILHVARLTEKKGTTYLLEALSKVKNDNLKLEIIGDGPLKAELLNQVKELGIQDKVNFLGSKSHDFVLEKMLSTDIFCVPSVTASTGDSEGLGMVFLEAATRYTPVVATLHGGIPEAVENGKTGFLVPERDSEALAEKLSLLIDNVDLRKKMGLAARKMVEEKFDIEKQSKKLEKIYQSVIDEYAYSNRN